MEKKQSAVEWLVEQIDDNDMGEIPMWIYDFCEQAKKKEKQQIIEFLEEYDSFIFRGGDMSEEEYYNYIFKQD